MISEATGGSPDRRRSRVVKAAVTTNLRALPEPTGERNIKELLADVRASEKLLAFMTPLLKTMGCSISEAEVRDPYGGQISRRVSVIERGANKAYLILIPQHVLNAPSPDALEAMSYFETMLRAESAKVLICSEALDALHVAFLRMLKGWESMKSVVAHFVPWRALTDVWDTDDPADLEFALSLNRFLPAEENLTPLPGADAPPPNSKLTPEEIRLISTEIAELAHVNMSGHEAYFRLLIDELDLPAGPKKLAQLPSEDPALMAKKLVEWLAAHGQYPPDHRYSGCHLVGVLILELTREVGIGPTSDQLAGIARHRRLLSSTQASELPRPRQQD